MGSEMCIRDRDLQWFEPQQILAQLAELLSVDAPNDRTIDVRLKMADGIHVFADKRLFLRAIENLLRNAIQHANRNVLVELTHETGKVHVAIHDDGPGIPQALHEKVVLPFFRPQTERDRETGGVGLGLAIVARITQRHSGRLAIRTSPLGGAKVATIWPSSD